MAVEVAAVRKQMARLAPKNKKKRKANKSNNQKPSDTTDEPFHGDRTFSEAITFKRDAMIAWEVTSAAAEGDVGQVWEGLKVMGIIMNIGDEQS